MKFSKIKHSIHIPEPKHGRGAAKGVTQGGPSLGSMLTQLEVGDCFSITEPDMKSIRSNIIATSKKFGIKTTTRWDERKSQLTIWRIS